MKPVFQVLSIIDSFLLLALLGFIWAFPASPVPLLTSGMLAGLNAVFVSASLEPLPYRVRVTLRLGGFLVTLAMAVSLAFVR
jgi:hypothetical protein